jgi:hypothetical protein
MFRFTLTYARYALEQPDHGYYALADVRRRLPHTVAHGDRSDAGDHTPALRGGGLDPLQALAVPFVAVTAFGRVQPRSLLRVAGAG